MGKSITFLHVADMHLGAPVRGLRALTDEWASRLARAIPESFDRVIAAALSNHVDFVVMAGDTFDASRVSYAEYLHFFEGMSKLDQVGIPVYLVGGNHDPYTMWSRYSDRFPPSMRLLGVDGPQFVRYEREGEPLCLIGARSYYNQTWPSDSSVCEGITGLHAQKAQRDAGMAGSAPFVVGLIHSGLDVDVGKAPASEEELLHSGVDYWACGHLHTRRVRPSISDPRIVYPGCIQGRNMTETGDCGCYVVTLEEGRAPQLQFVPTSSVILQNLAVDVSVCQTLGDLVHLVATSMFHANGQVHCDEMVTRVTLTGATSLHRFLAQAGVVEDLRKQINEAYPSFFCDALIDRTAFASDERLPVPADDVSRDAGDGASSAMFAQVLSDLADEQGSRAETSINYVQSEFVKRGIAVPGSLARHIGEFNESAKTTVLDLICGDDE